MLFYAENRALPMGCSPHRVCAISRVKPEGMKTSSRKRCATLGEFILRSHGGTDADILPVIPGTNFLLKSAAQGDPLQDTLAP